MGPVKAEGQLHRPFESRTPPFKHRVAAEDDIKGHQYSFHLLINLLTCLYHKETNTTKNICYNDNKCSIDVSFNDLRIAHVGPVQVEGQLHRPLDSKTPPFKHRIKAEEDFNYHNSSKRKNVVVLCQTHFISTFIHVLCNKITNTTEEFGSYSQPDFLSKTREGTKIQYKIRVTNTGPISVKVVLWNKQIEDLQVDQWVISSRRTQTSIEINGNLHFSQILDSKTSLNFTNCFQM